MIQEGTRACSMPPTTRDAECGVLGSCLWPGAPRTARGTQEGQDAWLVMAEALWSLLQPFSEKAVPVACRPLAQGSLSICCLQLVAAPALLTPSSLGGGESASGAEGTGRTGCRPGEPQRSTGQREGEHSPPHTAVRESQSSSSAFTQSLRFMLLLGPPARCAGGRARRPGTPGKERRKPRLARAGAKQECAHPSSAAGYQLPACSPPSLSCSVTLLLRGSAAKLASEAPEAVASFSKRLALLCLSSNCAWPKLPGRMLPAHSKSCIL